MSISSPGIGSNLDVNGIVSQLLTIDKKPITVLDTKTASFQAKLSGFGTLKSILSQFQTTLKGLSDASKFQGVNLNVADASVATATGSSIAVPGNYSIEVSKLAQAQKLNAAGQTSSIAPIGSGVSTTLALDFGTITGGTFSPTTGKYTGAAFAANGLGAKTVTIDSSNNSLSGIRDAINNANAGVTATIVNDGSTTPYRLSISNNVTGQANSLRLSVSGDSTLAALLSHDPSSNIGQALTETASAQNSIVKIDGITVSKTSNSITDAITGVTLNLAKTNVGAPTNLSVTRDTATVISSVNAFVKSFNDTTRALKDATAYDPATKTAAILNGESSVRSISNQIRGILSSPVVGGGTTLTLLSQVGVTVQKDGSLGVDNTKLQNAVTNNFSDIAGLFSSVGKTSDALIGYSTSTVKTVPGSYAVSITQLATHGTTTGRAAAGLTITAGGNDTLQVKLDGITSTITLAAGTYADANALATALQSKINGATELSAAGVTATVSAAGGVLSITSASYGSTSNASIVSGNGQANLAFDTGAAISIGTNVVGSINGRTAVASGQSLSGAIGDPSEGLSLLVTGGALGSRGTVTYTQGYAYQLSKLTDSFLATDGVIAARTDGISASIKNIAKDKIVLSARLITTEARYRAQFTALDTLISSLTTTSNFLTQQLAAIAKNN